MQIYTDITGRPMKLTRSDQTPALGAAMFGAIAADAFANVESAQAAVTDTKAAVYDPNPEHHAVYQRLYVLYKQMHDAFGTPDWSGSMYTVMKDLLEIRDHERKK